MIYISVILSLNLVLFSPILQDSDNGSHKGSYREIRKFSGFKAEIVVQPQKIIVYDKIDEREKEYLLEDMPNWKGEDYSVKEYEWIDTGFVSVNNYYTNDAAEAKVDAYWYKTSGSRNLKLDKKYLKVREISSLLENSAVKVYAEGDLNSDGEQDLVLVYQDTIGIELQGKLPPWLSDATVAAYHLVIFEKQKTGKYVEKFSYDFPSTDILVGETKIMDVNLDNLQDVILWILGYGGSGYSVTAQIFSRVKDQ